VDGADAANAGHGRVWRGSRPYCPAGRAG
jgi:hypothetical protein